MAELNLKFYKGEDLYSDGNVEDFMLELAKSGADLHEYIINHEDWEPFYHFSHLRQNVLNWYNFDENASILEVGGGLGAITGLLCEKCSDVTVVELSKRRSQINFERHKQYDNLEIIVGDINDISFDKKFDYITLIGVLEYAACFSDAENPYQATLNNLKKLLKPNGKIIIAIENRLGIKYFSGASEDHVGQYFEGINGYPASSSIKTFSKRELTKILNSCELSSKFYYALPDYKFVDTLYSDKALDMFTPSDFFELTKSNERVRLFDENTVLAELSKSHIADNFMNSFIVECGIDDSSFQNLVYAKFSNDRAREFRISTLISEDTNGNLSVEKTALTPEAHNHLDRIAHNSSCDSAFSYAKSSLKDSSLCMEYINGKTFAAIAKNALENQDIKGFLDTFDYISKQLYLNVAGSSKTADDTLCSIFGIHEFPQEMQYTTFGNADLILDNFICDDKPYLIDYEWVFKCNMPILFMLWYAIYHFYIVEYPQARKSFSYEQMLERYNITAELESEFISWREYFAKNYIHDSESKSLHILNPHTLDINNAIRHSSQAASIFCKLFYSEDGAFTEENSIEVVSSKKDEITLEFKVDASYKYLRFDPIDDSLLCCSDMVIKVNNEKIEYQLCSDSIVKDGNIYFTTFDSNLFFNVNESQSPINTIEISFKLLSTDNVEILKNINEHINAMNEHVNAMNEQIISSNEQIAVLNKKTASLETRITELDSHVLRQNDTISELNKIADTIYSVQTDNISYNEKYAIMLNSLSWKLTAPLRKLIQLYKSIRKIKPIYNNSTELKYSIDDVHFTANETFIRGWALHLDRNYTYKITATMNDQVSFCSYDFNEVRADVLQAFDNSVLNVTCGFRIIVPFSIFKIHHLTIYNCHTKDSITILMKDIMQQFGITKKNYKNKLEAKLPSVSANNPVDNERRYQNWIRDFEPTTSDLKLQKNTVFSYAPKISILTPTYNTDKVFLKELIDSLKAQTYPNWELCLADGGSKQETLDLISTLAAGEPRIKYVFLGENKGIAGNTVEALNISTGEYISLIDHDDVIPPFAYYEVVKAINDTNADFIYSDEDKLIGTKRCDPYFKPDFNQELLENTNYICHLITFKRELYDSTLGYDGTYDGAQDFDLVLKLTEKAKKIHHIPKILYHWRCHEQSTASNQDSKRYAHDAGKMALEQHFKRIGVPCTVGDNKYSMFRYVSKPMVQGNPKISILIPNKDGINYLSKCITSILERTTYNNYEIVIIENNSTTTEIFEYYKEIEKDERIRVIQFETDFNYSKINNFGVTHCTGEYILFLNNDIEVITPDWLENMLGHCQRDGIGAVGAKLYFENNTLQHGGVVIGMHGIADHIHATLPRSEPGYFAHAFLTRDASAVTAACIMISAKVFAEVGGFDEKLKVAFNDIDLCLRIVSAGYRIVWNAETELYHYESVTRGYDDTSEKHKRLINECKYIGKRWEKILSEGDKMYNPNLSMNYNNYIIREIKEPDPVKQYLPKH